MGPEFSLSVQFASEADELPARAQIRRWVAAALEHPAEITVRIVDAEEAQALNHDYRDKAYVPNVLVNFGYSFNQGAACSAATW